MLVFIAGLLLAATAGAAQDTTGSGALAGSVLSESGDPLAGTAICVTALSRCVDADSRGGFRIADLRPGRYELLITAPSTAAFTSQPLEVRAGLTTEVVITAPTTRIADQAVVVSPPSFIASPELATSAFLVRASEIAASAGALEDVSRYVQSLPGTVPGTDDFRNDLIVRGGSPLENLFIVDNIEIPNINAFANFASSGGSVGLLDVRLIQDVTFLTGGYPSSFGNRASSVLQIAQREGSRDQFAARATLAFAGAGGIAEGPLGSSRRGSWLVSLRRSFLDYFTDDVGIGGVPVVYTASGKATYDISPRDRVWIVNLTGVDRIRLGLREGSDLTSELSTLDIRYSGSRSATGFNWQRTFGSRGVGLLGVSHAEARVNQRVRDLFRNGVPPPGLSVDEQLARAVTAFTEESREADTAVKYDLTLSAGDTTRVQVGGAARRFRLDYDAASPFGADSPYFPATDQNPFTLRERASTVQFGGYGQLTRRIGTRISVTGGGRFDRYGYATATRMAPRASASIALSPVVTLHAAAGRYYQQPLFLFLAVFPENRALSPFHADHYVTGVTWTPDPTARLSVEMYNKHYADYPASTQIGGLSLANIGDTFAIQEVLMPLASTGRGRARGIELAAERKQSSASRWYGLANVTIARSRHAGVDGVLRPGSFDHPVVVNVVGGIRASRRWDVSARVAYLGGRPYTPLNTPASIAQRRAVYDTGQINGGRLPDYLRADLRADWRVREGERPASIYVGAQNITNRRNVSGIDWDRRNNSLKRLEQLGVFPILGVDWSF